MLKHGSKWRSSQYHWGNATFPSFSPPEFEATSRTVEKTRLQLRISVAHLFTMFLEAHVGRILAQNSWGKCWKCCRKMVHWKHDKTGLGVLKCSEDADKFTWANAVETPMLIFCWPSILVLCASSKGQSSAWSSSKTSAICGENWSWFVQTEGYPNLRPVHCWRLSFWKTWFFEFQNCRDKPILNLTLC